MPVFQAYVDVSDDAYPTDPQVVIPFTPDSFLFINQGGSDDGADTPSVVQIAFDSVRRHPDSSLVDDCSVDVSGPGQSLAVNERATRVFLRNVDSGAGTTVKIIANKAK
jgi:hypothetical protein